MQAQHLPHAHAPPIPMGPHPAGLQPPGLPVSSAGMNLFTLGPGHAQAHISSLKEDKGTVVIVITTPCHNNTDMSQLCQFIWSYVLATQNNLFLVHLTHFIRWFW